MRTKHCSTPVGRYMLSLDGPGAGPGAPLRHQALAEYWAEMAPRASAKVEASRNAADSCTARLRLRAEG